MSAPKFCKNCQFWSFTFSRDKQYGICDDPLVHDKILMDREQDPMVEETVIHTEEYFGCIYHTPLHGNVVTKIDEDE